MGEKNGRNDGVVVILAATRNPRQSFFRAVHGVVVPASSSLFPHPLCLSCCPPDYVVLGSSLFSSLSFLFWIHLVFFPLTIACSFLFSFCPILQKLSTACDSPACGQLVIDLLPLVLAFFLVL